MPSEGVVGVLRRGDWAKGFIVISCPTLRERVIPFDLTPRTPDYRQFVGRDVKCVVEDGQLKSLSDLK